MKMRKLVLSMSLFLITTLPGWSSTLQGRVETFESQEDLNYLDWTEWRKNIAYLVHNKIMIGMKMHPGFYWGETEAKVIVTKNRRVRICLIDHSVNLDNLVYRSYKSLDKSPVLSFPPGSHRREISIDTIYCMTKGEEQVVFQEGDLEKI